MNEENNWLEVGNLVAPHGLRGEIRVNPSSDFPERFTKPGIRWLQKGLESPSQIELTSGKQIPGKSIYVVSFRGINDRQAAETLIGQKVLVLASDRPSLNANEFHFLDLLGMEVRLEEDELPLGHITNLINGGNDLLEIELIEGKKILVPFVKEIVPEIKLKQKWLKITPPPGLLEL